MGKKGSFSIGKRAIGPGEPCYVIAEMSANHHGDLKIAREIIERAKECGADAIKVQTYTADLLTLNCDNEHFTIKGTLWDGETLHALYERASMPWEWHEELQQLAQKLEIDFFSTPTHPDGVAYLQKLNVPVYKVPSFEIVDLGLLRSIARTGKPVILSTGMATIAEVDEAVQTLRDEGCEQIALLKCTSAYPAPAREANLRTIPHLAETFEVVSGLSDHTLGTAVPVAAVCLGASIIEKHFTLDRSVEGPDSPFSLEPAEFKKMVEEVRFAESALGEVRYGTVHSESKSRVFRRSLFSAEAIKKGELLTEKNVRSVRPGYGLHPRYYDVILGKRAACDIERGTPLSWELLLE